MLYGNDVANQVKYSLIEEEIKSESGDNESALAFIAPQKVKDKKNNIANARRVLKKTKSLLQKENEKENPDPAKVKRYKAIINIQQELIEHEKRAIGSFKKESGSIQQFINKKREILASLKNTGKKNGK